MSTSLEVRTFRNLQGEFPYPTVLTSVESAELILQNHPAFRGRFGCVQCESRNDVIQLTGNVPSYYLKQLAQELLRKSLGDQPIENQIVVHCPGGESSPTAACGLV